MSLAGSHATNGCSSKAFMPAGHNTDVFFAFPNPTNGIFLHDFCLLDGIRSLIGGDNLTFAVTVSGQPGVGQHDNSFTDAPRTSNAYECKYHIYLLQ